jgi:hypothetical protein
MRAATAHARTFGAASKPLRCAASGAIISESMLAHKGGAMSFGEIEPSEARRGEVLSGAPHLVPPVTFERGELDRILGLYGRKVAEGEWRDYAIDFLKDRAVFSVFRRASEVPIYRIEKNPRLSRRQGAYAVISATGLILKRGHELERVLRVLDPALRLVAG